MDRRRTPDSHTLPGPLPGPGPCRHSTVTPGVTPSVRNERILSWAKGEQLAVELQGDPGEGLFAYLQTEARDRLGMEGDTASTVDVTNIMESHLCQSDQMGRAEQEAACCSPSLLSLIDFLALSSS